MRVAVFVTRGWPTDNERAVGCVWGTEVKALPPRKRLLVFGERTKERKGIGKEAYADGCNTTAGTQQSAQGVERRYLFSHFHLAEEVFTQSEWDYHIQTLIFIITRFIYRLPSPDQPNVDIVRSEDTDPQLPLAKPVDIYTYEAQFANPVKLQQLRLDEDKERLN